MNIKLAAVNALRFVKKFGLTCGSSGTKGLVRLADGTVEEQFISWSRRGKVVTFRRVVGNDELAQFSVIGYLEDHFKPAAPTGIQPVRGRTNFVVYLDDWTFRPPQEPDPHQRNMNDGLMFLMGYKGATWMEEGIVDPSVKEPAHLKQLKAAGLV